MNYLHEKKLFKTNVKVSENHSNENDGNTHSKQYYTQKRTMLDNKSRMQQEISGKQLDAIFIEPVSKR